MNSFQDVMILIDEIVGYKYVMSFILIFAVILGLIDVAGIFKRKETQGNVIIEKKMWKLQVIIALAITFMALYNPTTADLIFRAVTEFTNWVLVVFMGIVILYTFTKVVIFKGEDAAEEVTKKITKYVKWTTFFIGVSVFLYFVNKYSPPIFEFMNVGVIIPLIILLSIIAVPILWIYYNHFRNKRAINPDQVHQMRIALNKAFDDCMKRRMKYYVDKGYDEETARRKALEECKEAQYIKY